MKKRTQIIKSKTLEFIAITQLHFIDLFSRKNLVNLFQFYLKDYSVEVKEAPTKRPDVKKVQLKQNHSPVR